METLWDWVTIACFGGLVVLMLERSTEENPRDTLIEYLFPAVGCGVANYIGNHFDSPVGQVGAAAMLVVVAAYVFKVLKWPPIGPNKIDGPNGR